MSERQSIVIKIKLWNKALAKAREKGYSLSYIIRCLVNRYVDGKFDNIFKGKQEYE